MFRFLIATALFSAAIFVGSDIPSLPYCSNRDSLGLLLVSTLDGKLSALNATGDVIWQIDTGPGPLLDSNIHNLELTNNGEWVRIIPSLSGTLYKFDGSTVDPILISTENLLKSSFQLSEDLIIAGGIEVRTYGVGFRSGSLYYECNSASCSNKIEQDVDDVLLVERSTHTIRAVEPRTGNERWNFSVGLHDIKLHRISCIDDNVRLFDWNLTVIVPKGNIQALISYENVQKFSWQHVFSSPIVRVWKWTGRNLTEVNLFGTQKISSIIGEGSVLPSIYLGMHNEQLYIHESSEMQEALFLRSMNMNASPAIAETTSIIKIPWKAIPASTEVTEDDSTALSVLNASKYVNGHGFYLYSETILKVNRKFNESFIENAINGAEEENLFLVFLGLWWKEFLIMGGTIFLCNFLFKIWSNSQHKQEIIIIEKPVDAHIMIENSTDSDTFTSRYMNDFDTVQCLGRGGFGVVFEVKKKIDECNYAIKRITLPYESYKRERVMREVKALAKLEHQNIVRYFSSWVEKPPVGWQEVHDRKWMGDKYCSDGSTTSHRTKRTKSVSINIPPNSDNRLPVEENEDDDFQIVFKNSNSSTPEGTVLDRNILVNNSTTTHDSGVTDHMSKKVNWKRPGRMHHSWDLTQHSQLKSSQPQDSPLYLYIQMQLCQKESLKDWLVTNFEREYKFVLDVFSQILDAVEYIHLKGLIHRDLKPSNIFFSLDGQIKVGDFGLVKDMEDAFDLELMKKGCSPSYRGHTREVGTQLYMSPEQFKSRRYDYKVDIYSLGLIFFELLVPFGTEMERIRKLTDAKQGRYPSKFIAQFPDEHTLLQSMLCENPNKRLTTIGIKARPPFNVQDSTYGEDCHYRLNIFQKTLC